MPPALFPMKAVAEPMLLSVAASGVGSPNCSAMASASPPSAIAAR